MIFKRNFERQRRRRRPVGRRSRGTSEHRVGIDRYGSGGPHGSPDSQHDHRDHLVPQLIGNATGVRCQPPLKSDIFSQHVILGMDRPRSVVRSLLLLFCCPGYVQFCCFTLSPSPFANRVRDRPVSP